ncbi:hypothetical protein AKJ38_02530 [candidate division MSBL1 archaeon SCGC-AAA259I14]|uniref:Uncharacterized protein n=1 Tax=candidate division MSBL1 archaeon SCGC-AAA259I14 TaxID=1698268 RepID=A0A133URS3_9EURY|nr:hypothetical protein AKJ38_02530 [candidate division MSBL1 archaeon SCGC-AAA259I14]
MIVLPEEEPEEETEPVPEEESGEKNENGLESADVAVAPATPLVVCQEDSELMEIEGVEIKKVEERGGFLGFGSSEELHTHLKYKCPTCGK